MFNKRFKMNTNKTSSKKKVNARINLCEALKAADEKNAAKAKSIEDKLKKIIDDVNAGKGSMTPAQAKAHAKKIKTAKTAAENIGADYKSVAGLKNALKTLAKACPETTKMLGESDVADAMNIVKHLREKKMVLHENVRINQTPLKRMTVKEIRKTMKSIKSQINEARENFQIATTLNESVAVKQQSAKKLQNLKKLLGILEEEEMYRIHQLKARGLWEDEEFDDFESDDEDSDDEDSDDEDSDDEDSDDAEDNETSEDSIESVELTGLTFEMSSMEDAEDFVDACVEAGCDEDDFEINECRKAKKNSRKMNESEGDEDSDTEGAVEVRLVNPDVIPTVADVLEREYDMSKEELQDEIGGEIDALNDEDSEDKEESEDDDVEVTADDIFGSDDEDEEDSDDEDEK